MQTKNIVVLMDYAGEMGSDCLKTFLENDIKISAIVCVGAVSYTHLTLPTNREV